MRTWELRQEEQFDWSVRCMSETQWEGGKAYRLGSGHATEARKQTIRAVGEQKRGWRWRQQRQRDNHRSVVDEQKQGPQLGREWKGRQRHKELLGTLLREGEGGQPWGLAPEWLTGRGEKWGSQDGSSSSLENPGRLSGLLKGNMLPWRV